MCECSLYDFFNFSVCLKNFIIKFGKRDKKRKTATRDASSVPHNENVLEANRRGLKKKKKKALGIICWRQIQNIEEEIYLAIKPLVNHLYPL